MPPVRHPPRHLESQIWERNELTIRHLYQTERKTLKQVKEIMEAEHGFPVYPLSIYETRLRDVLGLRKKLKKTDWTVIYQHYQDREGKDTGVYLNGSRIPWEKAWKEIRRSGARLADRSQTVALPSDVVVRTPSPVPVPHNHQPIEYPTRDLYSSPLFGQPAHIPHSIAQSHQGRPHSSTALNVFLQDISAANSLKQATIKYSLALSDIPWNIFKYRALSAGDLALQTNKDLYDSWKVALSSATLPPLNLGTASSPLASTFDVYHFFAIAIEMISNGMVPIGFSFRSQYSDTFKLLLNRVPKRVLIGLFQFNLPTVRVTWECLVYCAGKFAYRDSFHFLIDVGLQHLDWVLPRGASYLGFAACMGSLDVVRSLLEAGARADGYIECPEESPLVEAAATGNLECVELLLGKYDLNRVVTARPKQTTSTLFFQTLTQGSFRTSPKQDHAYPLTSIRQSANGFLMVDFNVSNESLARTVDMIWGNGANFDLVVDLTGPIDSLIAFCMLKKVPVEWHPTLVELSYYRNKDVFYKVLPYITRRTDSVSRSDIWLSAERGMEALIECLTSLPSDPGFDMMGFLELILAEQFEQEPEAINIRVVQGLLEYGVDPNRASLLMDINYFLCCLVMKAPHLDDEDFLIILRLLLHRCAVIDEEILEASIEKDGIDTLSILSDHGADVGKYGGGALSTAAWLDNYDAVSWLLDAGVDINAMIREEFPKSHQGRSILASISTRRHRSWGWEGRYYMGDTSCEMLKYLMDHGALLRNSPEDATSFEFLYYYLSSACQDESFADKMQLFLNFAPENHDLVGPRCLLEACIRPYHHLSDEEGEGEEMDQRLAVFELLLERGVPVADHRVLPSLVYYRGRHEIIRRLILEGMDINVYSCGDNALSFTPVQAAAIRGDNALVAELVQMGADINKPAAGKNGRTALQAACDSYSSTTKERAKKMELIQFLIERGADVNAPPAPDYGFTALQFAAGVGDLEVALVLLYHEADVNALVCTRVNWEDRWCCALDLAASNGRLDMVKLLLNVGALSYERGESGYEGAICVAEVGRYFAVADLIREHAERNMEVFGMNLAMTF